MEVLILFNSRRVSPECPTIPLIMSSLPIPIKPSVLHEHPHNPQSHLNRTFYSTGKNSIKYNIIIITSSPSDSNGEEESGHSSVSAGWDSRAGMGQKNYVVLNKVHSASVPDLFSSVGATRGALIVKPLMRESVLKRDPP